MNKTKVINALNLAVEEGAIQCKYYLYQRYENAFCALGWLAYKAGMTKEELHNINGIGEEAHRVGKKFHSILWKTYRISRFDRSVISGINDHKYTGLWNDVIKGLKNE